MEASLASEPHIIATGVMGVSGIIFDMDGTLLDTERLSSMAWAITQERMERRLPEGFVQSMIGIATHRSQEMMAEVFGSVEAMRVFWADFSKTYDALVAIGQLKLKPGAREILDWAQGQGLRLALATSTRRVVADRKLIHSGLGRYFEHVVCGDEVAESKPHPMIFLTAAERLGLAPAELVAIEDSPNGLRSAVSAGLRSILVPDLAPLTDEVRALATVEVPNLMEAQRWIAQALLPADRKNATHGSA